MRDLSVCPRHLVVGALQRVSRPSRVLDDEPDRAAATLRRKGIADGFVESLDAHRVNPSFTYVIGVGNPDARLALASRLGAVRFVRILHPTSYVAPSAVLAEGVVVCPFSFVGAHARLEAHVVLNTYASCGHDSRIGTAGMLSPYAVVNGDVVLEERAFLGRMPPCSLEGEWGGRVPLRPVR